VPRWLRNLLWGAVGATVTAAAGVGIFFLSGTGMDPEKVWTSLAEGTPAGQVVIGYPLEGTLFPPEICAPTVRWQDENAGVDLWLVTIELAAGGERISEFSLQRQWRPEPRVWEQIKSRSRAAPAVLTVVGVARGAPTQALSAGRVTFRTSTDEVGAPLFYREVNLPFAEAVSDPSTIRWRFGPVSAAEPPPVVLENLPVCGNCHSFSANGAVLGMDVDYANDKGSYAIVPVRESMTLDRDAIITWSDYHRDEGETTFGLLSQVSPDGRFVVSTVKDESVFVPKPGLDFSQLFFPVKGILCVYDRQTGTFRSLPGANDPQRVQSNPTWSPDGRYLVFAAAPAYRIRRPDEQGKVLLSPGDCREFLVEGKPFKFDLYRIPFNEGRGGRAEPLAGASDNGKSNFFPRYSPDGKWIVFCRAENYMLLQPDSELYIIPAAGGEARRLRANTRRMNSWHSFSPNGKWLVFSGKPDSPYTRLYLTRIDEQGESTPPVVLDRLTAADRAANIPEFVNVAPTAIRQVRARVLDDVSYARAAWECFKSNDFDGAERQARRALELNPANGNALHYLGLAFFGRGQCEEALRHLSQAAAVQPADGRVQVDLASVYIGLGRLDEGVRHLHTALELAPELREAHFNLGVVEFRRGNKAQALECWLRTAELDPHNYEAHHNIALLLDEMGRPDEALDHYRQAARLQPDDGEALVRFGMALCAAGAVQEGLAQLTHAVNLDPANSALRYQVAVTLARYQQHDQAIAHFLRILRLDPRHTGALVALAASYAAAGQMDKALGCLQGALQIAQSTGNEQLARQITERIRLYRRLAAGGNKGG
jgi:tetratricopeptide (TPR) repeat protein